MKHSVLVIGSGPVGLAHAIELSRLGHPVRIIDKNPEPSPYSKAIVINPKTLSLLEASGASAKLIEQGIKIPCMRMHDANGKVLAEVHVDLIKHHYPFMLAVPQYVTEKVLTDVLAGFGVQIERAKEFIGFAQDGQSVIAEINTANGIESIKADYLIGADGAHSQVRKSLEIEFSGFAYDDQWNLADVTMDWDQGDANVYMLKNGIALIIIRIAESRYRIISNHPDALSYLPKAAKVKQIFWQSDFKVSCRQVQSYQKGRVFLMGDAAHIHSPAGGRGMNLGIEDACILAALIDSEQTDQYSELRYPVGKKVIKLTSRLFRVATLKSPFACVLRNFLLKCLLARKFIQMKVIRQIAGLQ
ncbi:MAG: Pentachlorophenol monooxygenase [Gammaproteobacteria bacterium]|jgi:2-polyprenyl-6-methoxyphenol hydroxylase-like FAD-dependent oxidoreductase|nr:Pentachlorophenol monooxygenase [Gammaproteobacteria bacterium]